VNCGSLLDCSDNRLTGADPLTHRHSDPVIRRKKVIDAATEHDQPDSLAWL
jgi:hypothetical protein